MRVRVRLQGLKVSNGMDQLILRRISRLERYFSRTASIEVSLCNIDNKFLSEIKVSDKIEQTFLGEGFDSYEALTQSIDKASRILTNEKREKQSRLLKDHL